MLGASWSQTSWKLARSQSPQCGRKKLCNEMNVIVSKCVFLWRVLHSRGLPLLVRPLFLSLSLSHIYIYIYIKSPGLPIIEEAQASQYGHFG